MNRKTKNILFWVIVGLLAFAFALTLFLGIVNSFVGAGHRIYYWCADIIKAFGLNSSPTFAAAPFICVACGSVACFMFYKKYNTRIN